MKGYFKWTTSSLDVNGQASTSISRLQNARNTLDGQTDTAIKLEGLADTAKIIG